MIKVLLVAPTDPDSPSSKPGDLKFLVGGENTYTKTLLANPPHGVKYTYHLQALKERSISYLPIQKTLASLVKFRILPLSAGSQCFKVYGDFDLVHCHAYSLKIVGRELPVILSDSSSNYLFLKDYLNWPEWKIKAGFVIRKFLFKKLGVSDPDTNLENVSKLIVFSKFAKDVHLKLGASEKKIAVILPGLPYPEAEKVRKNKGEINILFVGIWFERKGGPFLLEAFKILSKKFSNIRLTIVGPVPKSIKYQVSSIKYYDFVPRDKLLSDFFPQADIFVLVPPKAEGFGFVVLEAASFGIPAIVSRVYALPEIVNDKITGFVIEPNNLGQLVNRLEKLINDDKLRQEMGLSAAKKFKQRYEVEVTNGQLLKTYQSLL